MRSRYTAYAIGGYGEYLLASWHPDTAPETGAATLSQRELDWQGLQILDHAQHGDTATVTFAARFANPDGSTGQHHEISRVVRIDGKWLYLDGQVS